MEKEKIFVNDEAICKIAEGVKERLDKKGDIKDIKGIINYLREQRRKTVIDTLISQEEYLSKTGSYYCDWCSEHLNSKERGCCTIGCQKNLERIEKVLEKLKGQKGVTIPINTKSKEGENPYVKINPNHIPNLLTQLPK